MQKSKEMTALQWLAPSMARDGLLKNGDWVLPAAAEAEKMFSDAQLHLPAQFLAALNKFALDYIRQAPVLVVAAAHGRQLLRRQDRVEVGQRFIAACENGTKLGKLLESYQLAPQLRALSARAVRHDQRDMLVALSAMVPASPLSQAIPKRPDEQLAWLRSLQWWRAHMGRHFRNKDLLLDWAAINVRDDQARRCATDVADFAGRNRERFNLDWNFQQALAATQRWHGEIALHRPIAEASRPDWRTVIDYAPLPSQFEVDDIAFVALQTREALHQEGARLHHCVRLYSDKVARGSSRIYSVRQAGVQTATLEIVRTSRAGAATHKFRLAQLKGPRNINPSEAIWKATTHFLATVNKTPMTAAPDAPGASVAPIAEGSGSRSRELLRRRLGEEVYAAWFGNFLQFETFDGAVLGVSLPTRFLKRWIETHYLDALMACCSEEFAGLEAIEVSVLGLAGHNALPPAPALAHRQWA